MIREQIRQNLKNCLVNTQDLQFPGYRRGKVRDLFDLDDRLLLIATDRQSAFDRILAAIPFKGQVLNQVSAYWFEQTSDIIQNHVLEIPDPNVVVAKKCKVIPIEFVVRGYLTGSTDTSVWMHYKKGIREYCGHSLPEGLSKNMKFPQNLITPTTKDAVHDELISAREIVQRGIMTQKEWDQTAEVVLALFERGQKIAAEHGLILVDTKYELGYDEQGELTLIDEVHTPDSSRYWLADSYAERIAAGQEPENIDKEFLRLWFRDHCDPYNDPELPPAPDELVEELSARYIQLYEMITRIDFQPAADQEIMTRLQKNLAAYRK